jgi:hypothetical protein
MSSGADRILDISSAWSVKGIGGRRGGASGSVRTARSVAVTSFCVSVAKRAQMKCESEYRDRRAAEVEMKDVWRGTGPRC